MAHTLTLDDIFAIERVTDAQMSPDGAHVVFVVTREFTEGEHSIPKSDIWIASFEGKTPARQFTANLHADKSPRWRPDGKMLAFLSDRAQADVLQVYVMPTDGG
jgi:Tol biopolymer transport system component